MTNGESGKFIQVKEMSKSYGLELIESILIQNPSLFKTYEPLSKLLKQKMCPLLIKSWSEKSEYALTVRLMRVSQVLIRYFHDFLIMETEILISLFKKILESEASLYWQKILVLELYKFICSDAAILRSLFVIFDSKNQPVFSDLVSALSNMLYEEKKGLLAGTLLEISKENKENAEFSFSWNSSLIKVPCMDQLDKLEMPHVPDTYHLSLAIQSLNFICDNHVSFILARLKNITKSHSSLDQNEHHDDILLSIDMMKLIGANILSAYALLLLSHMDDDAFGLVLKSFQNLTIVVGLLGLTQHRDAFILSITKCCVPLGTNLSMELGGFKELVNHNLSTLVSMKPNGTNLICNERHVMSLKALIHISLELQTVLENRIWYLILETFQMADNLVATGKIERKEEPKDTLKQQKSTPIQSSLPNTTQAPSVLNENSFLSMSNSIKKFFEKSKDLDMRNLSEFTRALCQLAQETAIGASLNSTSLSNSSKDTMKVAEEKSFAVSKLLEVALGNVERLVNYQPEQVSFVDIDVWDIIIGQLIEISHTPASTVSIRSQACAAFGEILTAAIQVADLSVSKVELRIIEPIKNLILIESLSPVPVDFEEKDRIVRYSWLLDVQKSALETLFKILQAGGQNLSKGWEFIFEMMQGVLSSSKARKSRLESSNEQLIPHESTPSSAPLPVSNPPTSTSSYNFVAGKLSILVRLAFPSIQLICSDFLSLLKPFVLSQCIETVALFGSQTDDLNISLTAIGLLWSISDFVLMKKLELERNSILPIENVEQDDLQSTKELDKTDEMKEFKLISKKNQENSVRVSNQDLFLGSIMSIESLGALWMYLLAHLSQLCSDSRPEVRNSANQSLFGTIQLNGKKLELDEWDEFIWKILFPLLERIQTSSENDLESKKLQNVTNVTNLPNTKNKQWDETKVLTLSGVSKCFVDYLHVLCDLGERFDDAWIRFLEYVSISCIHGSNEVSTAGTKSLKTLLQYSKSFQEKGIPSNVSLKLISFVQKGWKVWTDIGYGMIMKCDEYSNSQKETLLSKDLLFSLVSHGPHTQDNLTLFTSVFMDIFDVIQSEFTLSDLEQYLRIYSLLLLYHTSINPQDVMMRYKTMMLNDLEQPTSLQQSFLNSLIILYETLKSKSGVSELLIKFVAHFVSLPLTKTNASLNALEEKTYSYDALSKKCIHLIEEWVIQNAQSDSLYNLGAYEVALESLGIVLRMKYNSPVIFSTEYPPSWRLAINSLVNILGITLANLQAKSLTLNSSLLLSIYKKIVSIFDDFLLPNSTPSSRISLDELATDEAIDVKLVDSIVLHFIWYFADSSIPDEIPNKVLLTLVKASRLYSSSSSLLALDGPEDSLNLEIPTKIVFKELWNPSCLHSFALGSEVIPVKRIDLAKRCIHALFSLCKWKPDAHAIHIRIAELTLPILLKKCQTILLTFMADRPLCVKMPMQRYIKCY